MKIKIFESDEETASDLTRDNNVSFFLRFVAYLVLLQFFAKMSKLTFSEYYLISSACFKMPPDLEIKLLNDSTGFHRQDLGGTRPGGML